VVGWRRCASHTIGEHQARRRRNEPPDDATIPFDRMRGAGPGSGRPAPPRQPLPGQQPQPPYQPQPSYGQSSYSQDPYQESPNQQEPARPKKPAAKSPRRIPIWAWLAAAGGLVFGAIILLLFLVLFTKPGYTLLVRGAAAGSDVFVENVRRGVPMADGTIRVADLRAGPKVIRVSHEGCVDFSTSVVGKDGEVKTVIAQVTCNDAKPVQTEIDYNGPMIFIPAGEYIMGDDNHSPNERPAHKVTLPDYYIDKFEVSNSQYKRFCDQTKRPYPPSPHWDEQYFNNNPEAPVVGVNWNDAEAYAKWAGKRLPTEEEWEKAASWDAGAQKKRQWPWGDTPDASRIQLQVDHPSRSGSQPGGASAYGVQDMASNASEWVESYYQAYPGNPSPDPEYGATNRVVRGGNFHKSTIDDARTTVRYGVSPVFTPVQNVERNWLIGFRCAVNGDDPRLQEFLRAGGVKQ
jgi:formylglycine-generating enzyme required for sulfatase activity